jgi:hypothetical protein
MQQDNLRLSILDKIISITDEDLLERIDRLLGKVDLEKTVIKVNERQQQMLLNSEDDILKRNFVADEELNEEEEKWLNG